MLLVIGVATWLGLEPPAVQPRTAPATRFSAERARDVLARLCPEDRPHPTGSPEQHAVRERLLAELRGLGLEPELQTGVACSEDGTCAAVENVIARVPGREPRSELLLSAHYDSVPAGPGAGDDGQGTASLIEIARALRADPPSGGVVLLFTDGEELGLLGARLFVARHPLRGQIRAVLNLEARGSRGPSLMFESTPNDAWLIARYAAAPRPVTSSLFASVYRALPNDTDLSVFARAGLHGLNFAFIGGVERYHTPLDTRDALDWRSVQHQGNAVLATVRELGSAPLEPAPGASVFFDVLSLALVRLPARLLAGLGAAALLVYVWAATTHLRRDPKWRRSFTAAGTALCCAWFLPPLVAGSLGTLLEALGGLPFPIVATPLPTLCGLALLAIAGSALGLALAQTRGERRALGDLVWLAWLVLGTVLGATVPGTSYLCVLPGSVAALARAIGLLRPRLGRKLELAALAVVALLWCPVLVMLHGAIGLSSLALITLASAVALAPFAPRLAPLLGSGRVGVALGALGVLLVLARLVQAPYSAEVPQRLGLLLEHGRDGRSLWHAESSAGDLPAPLRAAAAFPAEPNAQHPWPSFGQQRTYSAPAEVAAPLTLHADLEGKDTATVRLTLEAPKGVWAIAVRPGALPLRAAMWRGQRLSFRGEPGEQRLLLVPGSDRAVDLELTFADSAPAELGLAALIRGLPAEAAPLLRARDARAVPSGSGDMTVVSGSARREAGQSRN